MPLSTIQADTFIFNSPHNHQHWEYNHRKSCVGEGHFFFACQRASTLYYAIKNTMELIKLQRERSPVPPMMASENVRTTDGPGALIDPIIHHTCIKQPITTPNLVSTQTHDDVISSEYTSLAHQDSAQTNTYDVPLGNTTLKQSPDQHDDVTSSEYTSLAHQDSAQTNTYDVPLGNTTLKQSPDQNDDVISSGYTSLAHQDSAQTNTYDVRLTKKQSPDQHDDDNTSGYMYTSLAHQGGAQTHNYDVPSPTR